MKKFTQLLTVLVFISLSIFVSCKKDKTGGDPEPDLTDVYGSALASATWAPTNVSFDEQPRTEWDGFSLTINYVEASDAGNIIANSIPTETGAEDVWGDEETFTLSDFDTEGHSFKITRSDNVEMMATLNADEAPSTLTLEFRVEDPNLRVNGFYGNWVFEFEKQ